MKIALIIFILVYILMAIYIAETECKVFAQIEFDNRQTLGPEHYTPIAFNFFRVKCVVFKYSLIPIYHFIMFIILQFYRKEFIHSLKEKNIRFGTVLE